MSTNLDLRVVVEMGGSTGTWVFTDAQQITDVGLGLITLLGEPNVSIVEAEDARSAADMASELVGGRQA